jgi:hypothetical protein
MKLRFEIGIIALALVILMSIVAVYAANYATGTTPMNVTVAATVSSITASGFPLEFGSVDANTNDNNATRNYACTGSGTCYNFTIGSESNTNADIAQKAAGNLLKDGTGPQEIGIGNVTSVGNQTSATGANLVPSKSRPLTTSWANIPANETAGVNTCINMAPGTGVCHIRYWLDVPAGQTAGNYNTTYYFCGLQTGQSPSICG